MFLQRVLVTFNVRQPVLQDKGEALAAKQRSQDAIGRRFGRFIADKFGAVFDNGQVVVLQDVVLEVV